MKKVRSDAKWNGLTGKQRESLEQWLFEDRVGYDIALERAQKELGFQGSRSSLRRFFERTAQERTLKSLMASAADAQKINGTPSSTGELRAAGMKVLAQLFFNGVTRMPEQMGDWTKLGRLLLQDESDEKRFRIQREANEIRRRELELNREKFQYDVMEQGQKALPELQRLEEANLGKYERNKRRNALRRRMFGPNIPEPSPENEAEEAQQAAQKLIDDAEREKYDEWWEKKFGHLRGSWRNRERVVAEPGVEEPEKAEGNDRTNETEETDGEGTRAAGEVVERGVVYPYGQ